ncbi:unnamed protein product, partial [Rotaria sp. Silwood2]
LRPTVDQNLAMVW